MHARGRQLSKIHMKDERFVILCAKKKQLGLLHATEG